MSTLTLAEALDLEVIRTAGPECLAGARGLAAPVRWVHSTELADIAPLLREGDLLLSTGIALPDDDRGLATFARSLAHSGAAGIILELGRRWTTVPPALVEACESFGLPLIALHHEVRFAAITQALGERIVDRQLAELREAEEVHDTFTELSISEAGPREILEAVQRLAGSTVVLESGEHQVVDFRPGPHGSREFLAGWAGRSRTIVLDARTTWDARHGWLVTRLGRRERDWGRLVVHAPHVPTQRLIAVVERGAAALAMHRLQDRHRSSQVRRTHQELMLGLLSDSADENVLQRCELSGFPVTMRQYVALAIRPTIDGSQPVTHALDDVMAAAVHAAHAARTPALVCESDQKAWVLLAPGPSADAQAVVDSVAAAVHRRRSVVVGAARAVQSIGEVDRTLRESMQVLGSVKHDSDRAVHRLEDLHVRGLLALLGDDDRVRLFAERELGPLRAHDERWGGDHLAVLRALTTHGSNKSDAAASLHMSRPVFYDRLAKIGRILKIDLDDPEVIVSLHVALIATDLAASGVP
ncbi:PucR family transcriptional regulator [Aeromicrobium yanjiei]|uniref:PucR family transcriptional regulator n=1 Tax=Aeromicrobium yanjiei TaxID=2662028 RepID=A0A5Q2MDC8_9ACTN|nr:PucR family transcriptional regulator [Aeromicrobium yanjiei]QGG40578.1 PucR family transcriptional regulator [Aeromicrobium yanjiei]